MKIKIVSRIEIEGCEETETIYDIYYGFTGLPITFPFCTKWKIDKAGLTKDELLKWFKTSCLGYRNITIKL